MTLTLTFLFEGGIGDGKEWTVLSTFHDADLQVDAIIGLPWLRERQLGVFPHEEALAR